MAAMRGCALGRRSAAIRVRARFVSLELGARRARGVRSKGGTGTSALQRLGWGVKRPGTLAQRPTRAATRGAGL